MAFAGMGFSTAREGSGGSAFKGLSALLSPKARIIGQSETVGSVHSEGAEHGSLLLFRKTLLQACRKTSCYLFRMLCRRFG